MKGHAHTRLDGVGRGLVGDVRPAVALGGREIVVLRAPSVAQLHGLHLGRDFGWGLLTVAAVIGLGGCVLGFRHHRSLTPVCFVVAGLAFNATGRLAGVALGPVLAQTLTAAGPLFMAYGMWRDRRACRTRVDGGGGAVVACGVDRGGDRIRGRLDRPESRYERREGRLL